MYRLAHAPAVRCGAQDGRSIGRIGGDPAEMMVTKGNPKAIATIDGLVRGNVRTSMPKPVNEGITQFYARKVVERHEIWPQIANGRGMRILSDHGAKLIHGGPSPRNPRA
jgi:hypothetical protein